MKRFASIKKPGEFKAVYRQGASKAKGPLIMYVADNHTDRTRLGVSVSKKMGNSVRRHLFTRRMREIFRLNLSSTARGKDIIIVARGRAADAGYQRLEECYRALLQEFGAWID